MDDRQGILGSIIVSVNSTQVIRKELSEVRRALKTFNIRFSVTLLISDIFFYTKLNSIPGILVNIDFEKAFDSVDWEFLDLVF
jgi:hypothetical protein